MDVKDLCLGALTFGNASGYDIKKFFQQSFSHFYAAGYGSIYPALAELTAAGLVSCRPQARGAGPNRKLYSLTLKGRRSFRARLAGTQPRHQVKSEFLVLMYFAHLLPPKQLRGVLDRQVAAFDQDLRDIQRHETAGANGDGPTAGARFVCGYGRTVLGAARAYLRSQRRNLDGTALAAASKNTAANHRGGQRRHGITPS